jgi:hypothetical protein
MTAGLTTDLVPFGVGTSAIPSDTLTIGGVAFLSEEHPSELEFPLAQVLAVHVNVGGSRVLQELGPNPEDVTWTGLLFAGNVSDRLAALKAMQVAAQPVTLSYLDQSYSVLIRKFTPKYLHRYRAQYSITVSVVADLSGQYSNTPPSSIDNQVNGISDQAQALLLQLAAQDEANTLAVQLAFDVLFAAIESGGSLLGLTGSALQNLVALAGAAFAAAETYAGSQSSGSPLFLMATLLGSYANLIGKNLAQGQAPAVVVIQGGTADLFDIAARIYGDPSLAFALAAANGLSSPLLSSTQVYQIVLPPLTQQAA